MKKLLKLTTFVIASILLFSIQSCKKDECKDTVCLNGGVCDEGVCECPTGYSGDQCQNFDPCANVTCLNGGTCANGDCDCPTGYSGSDCSTVLTPVSMTINQITLTDYPVFQSNGSGWDISDGGDPLISINSGTSANQNDYTSGYYTDATGQSLTYSSGLPITLNSLGIDWTIGVWDYDQTSANDFMAGVYFTPISKVSGFPSTIILTTASMSVTLNVTWNF